MTGTSAPRKKTGKPAGDDPVLLELGAQLAQRRRDIGALQADIAEKAGVSRSTLHTAPPSSTAAPACGGRRSRPSPMRSA